MSDSFAVTGFTAQLLLEEQDRLILPSLSVADALEIGQIATSFGVEQGLPIAVEVRIGDWIIYHASLPG